MARQIHPEDRLTAWRALVVAGGVAFGVFLILAASVGVIWLVGRSPSSAPAIGAPPAPTPTPRSLSLFREGQPTSDAAELPPASGTEGQAQQTEEVAASVTPTPALPAGSGEAASNLLGDEMVFSAPESNPFASFASGSWVATADTLRNAGTTADAEPWLGLASVPEAAFAVEAEIRINGLLDTFCDQSFGLAGGQADAGQAYGAGVLFPCGDGAARARVTDVSVWEDGYHADPLIAENAFDPGDGWRTYRFELREDSARLIVDGVDIVIGTLDPPMAGAINAEAGVWSQGVDLDIRKVEVRPLPTP